MGLCSFLRNFSPDFERQKKKISFDFAIFSLSKIGGPSFFSFIGFPLKEKSTFFFTRIGITEKLIESAGF